MLLHETDAQTVYMYMQEYETDNRTVYDILDQICKDTDLYLFVKQHKSKRNCRGAFYAIHSRWLGLDHVNAKASDAEIALQKESLELGEVCSPTCQVPYYPGEPHGIWVPRA